MTWIVANFQAHYRWLYLEIGYILIALLDVATVTAFVLGGMTGFAGHYTQVVRVVAFNRAVSRYIRVTISLGTTGHLRTVVAMVRLKIKIAVHFICGMALEAGHPTLVPVNISRNTLIFAFIFFVDSAAVTGRAGSIHRGDFFKLVSGGQPPAYAGRLANVTLAATGMATFAVVAKGFFYLRPAFLVGPCLDNGVVKNPPLKLGGF